MNENKFIWNPFLKGYFENPHEHLRRWREHNPVHKGINNCWILFRHEDVKFFLTSPLFKAWGTHEVIATTKRHLDDSENFNDLSTIFGKVLLFLNPPEHAQLRFLVTKVWNSHSMLESIREAVGETLESLAENRQVDLVADFARAVPTRLISKILGLPHADYARIKHWSYQFIAALEPFVSLYQLREYNRHAGEFHKYMSAVIQSKKDNPDNLFICRLLTVNTTLVQPLSRDEIISVLCMIFFAGIETSVNLLSQSILLLIKNPEQARLVRETDQLCGSAANELIRYVSPVNYTKRVATEEVEIRGHKIKAGESLLGAFISANFDREVFENPDQLDLTRDKNPHLGFGHGSHFCLGARLGREQISHSIPALFRRFPNISLQRDNNYSWDKLVMNRALRLLPVNLNG